MKGLLATTAVLGVLAIGGLPALALVMAADENEGDVATAVAADARPGPPAWANGKARGHDKAAKAREKKGPEAEQAEGERGEPGWAHHGKGVPPGWARNHEGRMPHGWAMREWARCVADAGDDAAAVDDCGRRPVHEPPAERKPEPEASPSQ